LPADVVQAFLDAVGPRAGVALRHDEPLHRYTSFRIGGPADLYLDPPDVEVLALALREAARLGIPVTRLGGGTNVLISDRGVRGLAVRLGRAFDYRLWSEEHEGRVEVEAGAASRLGKLVLESVERGLAGLEFAAGIPGSVGGGALMNAGAFGGEIGDAIVGIMCVTLDGEPSLIHRSRLGFSYRRLALDADVVITSVRFSLLRSSVGKLKRVVGQIQAKRRRRQPLGLPNAGSIFKNPPGTYAGRLIEHAGLKGRIVGGAQISPEHANFIVNLGHAKASDVRDLMGLIQDAVWERSGVWLEPEVRLVGDWG
jgi:UDP-N-acetylmuramate dehydrogenase